MNEGTWSGQLDPACVPGDLAANARASALRLINLYRFLADLPAVTADATRNQKAQACALMMDANNALNHSPPPTWKCNSAGGTEAAGKSNICSGRAVKCIDLYMSDFGNETTIGHRRWFLSNQLGPVGIGGTPGGSCHWVFEGTGAAGKPWLAYPPPGPVPLESIHIPGLPSVDTTGWTVQSYAGAYNLTNATATVKENGVVKPVVTSNLGANYGSSFAIKFVAQGWTTQAGKSYEVTISGGSLPNPIVYTVQPLACPPL